MTPRIAPVSPDYYVDVATVVAKAFGRADEALLIGKLRAGGDLCLELGAFDGDVLVGHVAFQPVGIDNGGDIHATSLAPLAVLPSHQRRGIGAALVTDGIARIRAKGSDLVFVLGNPAFYTRFGFAVETTAPFSVIWKGPHYMALALSSRSMPAANARLGLTYPSAFFEGAV